MACHSDAVRESAFFVPTDAYKVYSVYMGLQNSEALDANNLQIKPIKHVLQFIVLPLVHIYNLILETAVFPDAMKHAKISVIYKGGDRNTASNYRPISVLPVFSKGIEKLIFARMTEFFNKKSVLTDSQYGFRKDRSTEMALLTLKEYVLQSFENNYYTVGIFIDFSKAFDSLNHEILIRKLCLYGIRGKPLELLKSYLKHRRQYVSINKQNSSLLPIVCGVPQGSILGPLLFNVFINDIVTINSEVQFIMYADDCTLCVSGSDANRLVQK